ncbi:MAG TPA: ABC transporter permease [Candidatus Limnocylindria bacterium]|jgi:peptide/nickel transport system permease protein|nr:ABC transporter permease [Candidatus Limnocylindria bacterium]
MIALEQDAAAALAEDAETLPTSGRSLREIVWMRIRRDRVAMTCVGVLVFFYAAALFGPFILSALGIDPYKFDSSAISDLGGKPKLAWGGISTTHWLGVEWGTGRDIFAQLVWGLRISLIIATSATLVTVAMGTFIGIVAGYVRGWPDILIGQLMDLILAFPFLLIILALSGVLTQRLTALGIPEGNPSRITYLILVFSVFGWPYLARIVRGQVISLREREFVEAAIAMGATRRRILFSEILPNLWAPILVYTTLTLPAYIGLEAALSFLGVGIIPPDTTFGAMLDASVSYFNVVPSYLFIPGTVLIVITVSFNLVGDALRDALDPKTVRGM